MSGEAMTADDLAAQGFNVLDGDFHMPVLVLEREALDHNLSVMRQYCERHGVDLAPHAKTSMAPQFLAKHVESRLLSDDGDGQRATQA